MIIVLSMRTTRVYSNCNLKLCNQLCVPCRHKLLIWPGNATQIKPNKESTGFCFHSFEGPHVSLCNMVTWLSRRNIFLLGHSVARTVVAPALILHMDTLGLLVSLPEILLAAGEPL
jgi:hypothetical protein